MDTPAYVTRLYCEHLMSLPDRGITLMPVFNGLCSLPEGAGVIVCIPAPDPVTGHNPNIELIPNESVTDNDLIYLASEMPLVDGIKYVPLRITTIAEGILTYRILGTEFVGTVDMDRWYGSVKLEHVLKERR